MSWTTAAAIYFIIWWVVLFAVLPFGVRNASETGETVEPGNDPGAPTVPALGKKLIWTTVVATVVFAICWFIYVYRLVTLEDLATLWGLLGDRRP
jgi:predicted secreted protein